MKRQVVAFSLVLLSVGAFAQKKELKAAEKLLKSKDFAGALTKINSLEASIKGAGDKYKSQYYYIKGQAYVGQNKYQEAAETFNTLLAFEKKVKSTRYTPKALPVLNEMIQNVSKKANEAYTKNDYLGASKNFYLTYLLSPRDTAFAYNAAISATQAKKYDLALKYYKELKKIGYKGVEVQYLATNKSTNKVENLGSKTQRDLMVKSGKYLKPVDKATDSKQAEIVKNIALILKEQGKTDEAIAALQEARRANPKDLNLLLNEADMYVKLKKMDKFGELMTEAVKLNPNDPTLYYNLGVVNGNQGRLADATKYYKKAISLKPDYADAYMNLAAVVLEKDKNIVEEMNKNLSNFKKYDKLALQQKQVYREALPYLEKADKLNRTENTVKTLKSIYEVLEMNAKASEFKRLYKSMK